MQVSSFTTKEMNAIHLGLTLAIQQHERMKKDPILLAAMPAGALDDMRKDLDSSLVKVTEILENDGVKFKRN